MGFGFDALHLLERLNPTHNGSVLSIALLSPGGYPFLYPF